MWNCVCKLYAASQSRAETGLWSHMKLPQPCSKTQQTSSQAAQPCRLTAAFFQERVGLGGSARRNARTSEHPTVKVKMLRAKLYPNESERRVDRDRRDQALRRPERHHQAEEDEPLRQSFLIGRRQRLHALHIH